MALGSRDGKPVMVILAVVAVVGAMVAAVVLVYATQALGTTSQRAADAATTGAPLLEIESAYVRVVDGVPVELQWIIAAESGGEVELRALLLKIDTGLAQWNVSGAQDVAAVRDADGSLAQGRLTGGDILLWSVPLDGQPLPEGRPGSVTLVGGRQDMSYVLSAPTIRPGDHLSPMKVD